MAEFFRKQTIPVLLFTLLCSSTAYIYAGSEPFVVVLFTTLGLAYAFLLFALYEKLKKTGKTLITAVVIIAVMTASSFVGISLIETNYSTTFQWVMDPSSINHVYIGNIAAILLNFGFILGSALYYFTAVRYRSVFVFLICMCPFSLFAKTFTEIPVIYIILISTLFFVLMIMKASGESVVYDRRSYIAFGAFVVVVTASAAFLPKLSSAPYREDFDELITGISIGAAARADFSGFSDFSSYSTSNDNDTVIFTFSGDNPMLIKRQCFDVYDPDNEQWGYSQQFDVGYDNWKSYISWENPSLLSDKYTGKVETHSAWVVSHQADIRALYTPQNMTSISLYPDRQKGIYRTPVDEYFLSAGDSGTRYYKIEWCAFRNDPAFSDYYGKDTAAANSGGGYGSGYYKAFSEMEEIHSAVMSSAARRKCFKSDESYRRITELTELLTEGCSSAYEKARAIENFFLSPDFIYDKDFSPVDSSVENFIFNTKRGVCSDYATAMTLLCREAGLYSRYVEGFIVQKKNEKGDYYVTSSDSHAYVQVWLDGYGWTDFDPTSSNTDGGYVDNTFLIFGGIVLAGGVIAVGIIMLIPVVKKRRFMNRAARLKGGEQAIMLYPELNRLLHEKLGLKRLTLTVSELKEQAALRYGVDISPLADNYERAAYGGKETDKLDFLAVYRGILRSVKETEKEQKKHRKKKK